MAQNSGSSLGRSRSSSGASTIDPYDQAEQGIRIGFNDLTGALPLKARTLSGRSSHHSSDSTLAAALGQSFPLEVPGRSGNELPREDLKTPQASWSTRCINSISRIWPWQLHPRLDPPESYRRDYNQFQSPSYEDYPDGYPRLAGFMNSSPSFGIFRTFSHDFTRMLLLHESSLEEKTKRLAMLDKDDDLGGETTKWRLVGRYHEEGLDTTRIELQESIEKELIAYSTLLLQYKEIRSLTPASERDHDSLFRYMIGKKPLGPGEGDWIYHHRDFASLVSPRRNYFEQAILRYLDSWPNTIIKGFFNTGKHLHRSNDPEVKFYCDPRVKMFARLVVVFFAVLILFTPVILFLLTSLSRSSMAIVVLAFVFIFSVMMSLLMDAGDKEMLVGTATYCAVLVTFLGNLQRSSS